MFILVTYMSYNFLNFVLIEFENFKCDTLDIIPSNLKIIYFNGLEREYPSSYKSLLYSLKNSLKAQMYTLIKLILFHINETYFN